MMQQALDFERRNAMQAATDRADRDITGWSDVAYRFLRLYASRNEEVFAEDVTKAAQEWGLAEPPDPRSWGSLYQRAVREGLLIRTTQSRKRANGSLAMVYKSGRV